MFLRNLCVGAFLSLGLAVFAHGATVSFMVAETGLRGETPSAESSRVWENALLDVFFDAGHVVSNSPITRIAEKPGKDFPDDARAYLGTALDEALDGGAEFFVLAVMDYETQAGPDRTKPSGVSLRLFRTKPYGLVFSKDYGSAATRVSAIDELANAKTAARLVAAHLADAPRPSN